MKQLTHDNENDTWTPLGLAAARVLQRLEEQRSDTERDTQPKIEAEKDSEKERFVQTRLREIARFERRYLNNRS